MFLQNAFCSVFESPSLRNTRSRDKPQKVKENLTSKFLPILLEKVFDMRHVLFTKILFVVFLNSPNRETPTNLLKYNARGKKVGWLVGGSGI
jgi:hypothetical protein